MVLGILNQEGKQTCMIGWKLQQFDHHFFKTLKNSNIGMWGVYSEAMDWNIALHAQISFWISVAEEKNPAYGRHQLSQSMRIVEPIQI